jgi:DNA replication protein DnaC
MACLRAAFDAGHRLVWTTAVEFQDRVDDTLRGDRSDVKEANRYFGMCKHAGILVIDDFGKNTWNPTVERHLFGVIAHRKTHDLPVLWTANSTPLEILATAGLSRDRGAPLIGRLLEASTIEKV